MLIFGIGTLKALRFPIVSRKLTSQENLPEKIPEILQAILRQPTLLQPINKAS